MQYPRLKKLWDKKPGFNYRDIPDVQFVEVLMERDHSAANCRMIAERTEIKPLDRWAVAVYVASFAFVAIAVLLKLACKDIRYNLPDVHSAVCLSTHCPST